MKSTGPSTEGAAGQLLTCVEAVALPGAVAAGAPCPLVGRGLGHRHHHQALDGRLGVVGTQLHKATVDHKHDALHCDGGLCNVGGNDHLQAQAQRGSCELPSLRDPISQTPVRHLSHDRPRDTLETLISEKLGF